MPTFPQVEFFTVLKWMTFIAIFVSVTTAVSTYIGIKIKEFYYGGAKSDKRKDDMRDKDGKNWFDRFLESHDRFTESLTHVVEELKDIKEAIKDFQCYYATEEKRRAKY